MLRSRVGTIACLSFFALSCHVIGAPEALPPVSAAPPAAEVAAPVDDPGIAPVVAYLTRKRSGLTSEEIQRVAATIVDEARRHDLDPTLVMALIHIESRGNPFALSPVGAMGMMQIMPATGEELAEQLAIPWTGQATLFDPVVNVRMGVAYFKQLEERYGRVSTALAAYNWGPGHIDSRLRRGRTLPVDYPSMVLSAYGSDDL